MGCLICHKWKRSPNYMKLYSVEETISKSIVYGCFLTNILDDKNEYFLCNECCNKIVQNIANIRAIKTRCRFCTVHKNGCRICFGSENLKPLQIEKGTYLHKIASELTKNVAQLIWVCTACEEVLYDLQELHKIAYKGKPDGDDLNDDEDS